jgi:hypothetical protein
MNANLKDLKEEIKSSQAEMRSIICIFQSELKDTIQHEMRTIIQPTWSELDETTACNKAIETAQFRNDAVHAGASGDP